MRAIELTGGTPDPDCLHCVLQSFIDKFVNEHPHKSSVQVLGELAETVGELIGSGLYNDGKPERVPELVAFVSRIATLKAQQVLTTLDLHKPASTQ